MPVLNFRLNAISKRVLNFRFKSVLNVNLNARLNVLIPSQVPNLVPSILLSPSPLAFEKLAGFKFSPRPEVNPSPPINPFAKRRSKTNKTEIVS